MTPEFIQYFLSMRLQGRQTPQILKKIKLFWPCVPVPFKNSCRFSAMLKSHKLNQINYKSLGATIFSRWGEGEEALIKHINLCIYVNINIL